jgi:peptidoglycan/LPS O-acetylase OafA/YrhL
MQKVVPVEGLRAVCSIYVFLTHALIAGLGITAAFASLPLHFGQEAVIVFFVISGFVIALSVGRSGRITFTEYLQHRSLRIYPIYLLSLVLSAALVGFHFDWWESLGNLVMLQDFAGGKPGVLFNTFAGNAALWSLSYEWWFYLMFFPIYFFVPRQFQCAGVTCGGVAAVGAYNAFSFQPFLFLAYFPMWWVGAELGRAYCNEEEFPHQVLLSAFLLACAFAVPVVLEVLQHNIHGLGFHPILELRHAAASLFCVAVAWVLWKRSWQFGPRVRKAVLALGSISYGVYILHFPIVVNDYWGDTPPYLRFALAVPLVFAAAYLAEYPYQRFWKRLTRIKWRPKASAAVPAAFATAPAPASPDRGPPA